MRRNGVWTVFRKEVQDSLRDRRSLGAGLIYALLGPLAVGLALGAVARDEDRDRPLKLAVAGAERAPSLIRHLEQGGASVLPLPADLEQAVRRGEADVALVVAEDYPEDFRAARPAELRILYDSSRSAGRSALARAQRLLSGYGAQVASQRLLVRGVSPGIARPLQLEELNLATAQSRAALVLGALPIFLLMACFICGMNVAIDLTAGERERGSLEALLLSPVGTGSIVLGKGLASALFNLVGVALTLWVSYLVIGSARLEAMGIYFGLGPRDILLAGAVLLPLALLAPALQMLCSIFAHSFKEAQTYLSLLFLVPAVPGFLFQFKSLEPEAWMRVTPILAQQLGLDAVLRGEPVLTAGFGLSVLCTLLLAAVCLHVTGRLLAHERIIFGH